MSQHSTVYEGLRALSALGPCGRCRRPVKFHDRRIAKWIERRRLANLLTSLDPRCRGDGRHEVRAAGGRAWVV